MKNASISRLHRFALDLPGATEDHPWGYSTFRVNRKVFMFLHSDEKGICVSVRIPHSGPTALLFPFAAPAGAGLGKCGWISCKFAPLEKVPLVIMKQWIRESYCTIAPKKMIATLAASSSCYSRSANSSL